MRLTRIGTPVRILLGFIGLAALVAGVLVGAAQIRALRLGPGTLATLATLVVCALVLLGGLTLLWGAVRGEIEVRSYGRARRWPWQG
jgi:hypothetical protein